jgi:uncharacterized membrane protein YqjE
MNDAAPPLSRRILATLIEIGQTRLQMAATEMAQERHRLGRMSLNAAICLCFAGLGIVFGAVAVILACPAAYRPWAAGAWSVLFIGLAAGGWHRWQRDAAVKSASLGASGVWLAYQLLASLHGTAGLERKPQGQHDQGSNTAAP